MNRVTYCKLEQYMLDCMRDAAHDKQHIYRVLYGALDIAQTESNIDYDVLIAACLLHDIGREQQHSEPSISHADAGAEMAYPFLLENGFSETAAAHIRDCILTHSYRKKIVPGSLEAKILFDADKLDAAGAMGIARTLLHQGYEGIPLYNVNSEGLAQDGSSDETPSFFQEYKHKLEKIYSGFHTKRGRQLAEQLQKDAESFYRDLWNQVAENERGRELLSRALFGK